MRSALATSPDACSSSRVVRATTSPFFASWRWRALRLRGGVTLGSGDRATTAAIAALCHVVSLVGVLGLRSCLLNVAMLPRISCTLFLIDYLRTAIALLPSLPRRAAPHCLVARQMTASEWHRYALQRCGCWRTDYCSGMPCKRALLALLSGSASMSVD